VNDPKRTSTDTSADADEVGLRPQKGKTPVKEATQTAPELGDTFESDSKVISTFDCTYYALCMSKYWGLFGPSGKLITSMALLCPPSATVCCPLFTKFREPNPNSVSSHSESIFWT